jgi:DNA-binding transcriptional LysR family regulator
MTRLPDLEAWAIFARVADLGSFSRAGAELGLAKATVSKALTRLEARLGTPLFHRSSRRLSLTESGRLSLDRARRILAEGEAAEDEAASETGQPRGLVRMAAPVSFGVQNLGVILPGFLERYPDVTLDIRLSDRLVDLIAEGMDVALRIGVLGDSNLRARALCPVRVPLVASPGYVERHGAPSHPQDLATHKVFVFSHLASPALWHFKHPTLGECSVRVTGPLRLDNADLALPALLAGSGLAKMPDFVVWRELRQGTLVELLPEWTAPSGALNVVTPPGPLRPARVTALIDYLTQHFRHAPWLVG